MVDRDELRELYERRFHAFVGGAFAIVADPDVARDVVQESFARALNRRRAYRGDAPLEAWLWRIVLNAARDVARSAHRRAATMEELAVLAESADHAEPAGLVTELRALPERQRTAVFLHYYADLPYDEVARLLGVAEGTVAASLNAARSSLRRRLEEVYR
jgi:RNA polymerase sigma-70 factor (ECF subfamily)